MSKLLKRKPTILCLKSIKRSACVWITAFIVIGFTTGSVYADPTSQSISSNLIETFFSVDRENCAQSDVGEKCIWFIQYDIQWSKDAAYPSSPPNASGWNSFVWMVSDTNLNGTIVGSIGQYEGTSHVVTRSGALTDQEALDFRAQMYNDNWHVFTYYINAAGDQVRIDSNPGNIYSEMAANPTDPEIFEKNTYSCPETTGDPISLATGQFLYNCQGLQLPSKKIAVDAMHSYKSGLSFNGPFGYGWMLNYYMRLHRLRNGNAVIVSGNGQKTQYTFDGSVYVPPAGRFEVLEKNPDNSWTLKLSQGARYQFDNEGKLTAIEDRNNNTINLTYDTGRFAHYGKHKFAQDTLMNGQIGLDYRLMVITDSSGHTVDLNYNTDGLLDNVTDGTRVYTYNYDTITNDLLSITEPATTQFPSGVTKSFVYENHNVVQIQDAKAQYFVKNYYDSNDRVYQQDLGQGSIKLDYSTPGQVTETDRKNNIATYAFDSNGNMILKEEFTSGVHANDPPSFLTTYTYNVDSIKTSETFPRGNGAVYTYDVSPLDPKKRGNLLEIRRKTDMSAPDNDTNDIVTSITYEPQFNQVKTVTDPKGNVTAITYDYELDAADPRYATNGNPIFIEYPQIAEGIPTEEFAYNSSGQVTQATDANGNMTAYTYDPLTGYLTNINRDPTGINAHTHLTYDAYGHLDLVTDANNHTTDYDYDELGRLVSVIDPLGYVTKQTYDANGNVIKTERQADELATVWQTTEFTYDVLNNLKTIKDPLNRMTTYNYDNNENLMSIVDAELNTTSNAFDERDLLFTLTDANTPAGTTTYDYDMNGNLAKITDANNNETNYIYDLFDRLNITTYADSTFSDSDYDKNSNLVKYIAPSTNPIEYDYDELNRMVARRYPLTPTLDSTFTYDLASRMITADNAASQISFTYDALNRIKSNNQLLDSINYGLGYNYDNEGNLSQLVYPSGKTLDYTYDADNRLDIIQKDTVNFVDYNYDVLNRRTQKSFLSSTLPLTTYNFDIASQLSSITNKLVNNTVISQYAYPLYDNVGNRKQLDRMLGVNPAETTNYSYNNIYELTAVTGAQTNAFDYDNVGNRTIADGITYGTPNNLNQYPDVGGTPLSYDNNGNLTYDGANTYSFDEQNRLTAATNGGMLATYSYDAFNRRVSKTVDGVTTYFVYDGDEVIAEYDSSGIPDAEYILGDNIDEVLAMERGTNTYYYNYDGLGSVTEITDSTGALAENYVYDAYGNSSLASSLIGNPYMFTGRRWDEESGTYFYRARQYDPLIGRFLQRDPLGNIDSENLYQYTLNNPINYTDPTGEIVWDIAGFGLDVYFFQDSLSKFKSCKTWGNAGNLALDSLSFLPIIPTLGLLTRADDAYDFFKAANKVDDALDAGKTAKKSRINKLAPNPKAKGAHTVFDKKSKKYTTFDASGRPTKRFRGKGKSHGGVEPPITYTQRPGKSATSAPTYGRPSEPWEIMR